MNEVADPRVVRGDTRTITEQFAGEAAHLLPLPRRRPTTPRVVYRLCGAEAYIAFEGNRYEVPYARATALLPVRVHRVESPSTPPICGPSPSTSGCRRSAQRARSPHRRPPQPRPPDLELSRPVFVELGETRRSHCATLEGTSAAPSPPRPQDRAAARSATTTPMSRASRLTHALRFGAFDPRRSPASSTSGPPAHPR
ncbi:hypothetical protein [Nannocystis sp.]|uniref:hypothetical protein n=1 Tax=Nannocystis sp. TaxID=1962667 RepID=UPI0025DFF175|nr:hypothetical protein [Nannocystis sp.]MBK7830554.1 hypothetical protein [Nannocystis sp.]